MEYIGRSLTSVTSELEARRIPYTVTVTRPARQTFPLEEDRLYVIREIHGPAGEYSLLAAAKMGKGV